MKTLKTLSTSIFIMIIFSIGTTSCLVVTDGHPSGKSTHKGWYKNSHNPHHPFSDNPGHSKHKKKH